MKTKQLEATLYSAGGVLAVFVLLVVGNFILGKFKQRFDMTEEKAFTLSKGTKAILARLDTPVKIRFYSTQGDNEVPLVLKDYAKRVDDLLSEYRQASKGRIEVEKFDPKPDSDAEDSARLDGVEGQILRMGSAGGDKVYLGLVVTLLDEKVSIPFLSPEREKLLEYDISRAISRVANPDKVVVGVMSGYPVFGMPMNPMMMRMGQQGGQEPWVFISELKRDFTVKQVELNSEKIDDDIKVLLVVHPKEISETAQFAIDQFVMRGGKLIAFLDASPFFDAPKNQMNPMMQGPAAGSTLDKLLKAWGIEYDTAKVVGDLTFSTRMQNGANPTVLSINAQGINKDDIITAQVDSLLIPFAGTFSGTPVNGLKQSTLLKTTDKSQMVDRFMAQMAGEQIVNEFKSSGKEMPLAIRLTGKFKTAFPDGKPKAASDSKTDEKPDAAKTAESSLKESGENSVILVGDADMLNDRVSVQIQEIFGQRIVIPQNGNLNFVQSSVEQMGGDENLIAVRSRATMLRPFTVVKQMETKAEESFRSQIKSMEESLAETQRRLNELQSSKDKGQRFILSPEQQKEVENFRKKQADTNKKLKELRKNLNQEIDSLKNRLKWRNILVVPFLVALSGVVLAVVKRKRTSAK